MGMATEEFLIKEIRQLKILIVGFGIPIIVSLIYNWDNNASLLGLIFPCIIEIILIVAWRDDVKGLERYRKHLEKEKDVYKNL